MIVPGHILMSKTQVFFTPTENLNSNILKTLKIYLNLRENAGFS